MGRPRSRTLVKVWVSLIAALLIVTVILFHFVPVQTATREECADGSTSFITEYRWARGELSDYEAAKNAPRIAIVCEGNGLALCTSPSCDTRLRIYKVTYRLYLW